MEMPLAGIKVLDLSTMYPGPVCTMTLADFGAEVIRVEPTKGGDLWRYSLPLVNGLGMPYLQVNRNKKSICLNLKDPEAKEIFYRLVKDADVVVEQYRPGVAQRLGVDYDTLKKLNEKIVYCSISGFGQTGPYRLLAGHDINYISYAGILGLTARKGECPVLPGVQIGDVSGRAVRGDRHTDGADGRQADRKGTVHRHGNVRRRCIDDALERIQLPCRRRGDAAAGQHPHRPARLLQRL